jgi:hypothetical protein
MNARDEVQNLKMVKRKCTWVCARLSVSRTVVQRLVEEAAGSGGIVLRRKISRIGERHERFVITLPSQLNMLWNALWKMDKEVVVIIIPSA